MLKNVPLCNPRTLRFLRGQRKKIHSFLLDNSEEQWSIRLLSFQKMELLVLVASLFGFYCPVEQQSVIQ
jgi:hypothetical protein